MKILFPGGKWGDLTERLESKLPDCRIVHCSPDAILENISDATVIIPAMNRITAEIMDAGKALKLIHQAGVGLEGVDIPAATERGIMVANIPSRGSGNAESVAELAILHMMLQTRKYHESQKFLKEKKLGQPGGTTLYGKTIGIIGVGNIGQTLAKRLKAFEVKLIGVELFATEELKQEYGFQWLDKSDLGYLFENSDIVVVTAGYTPDQKGLITKELFDRMKPSAYFINVARGGFLERETLEYALKNNKVAGVGTDVFWEEPVDPNDPIFEMNITATPHIGAATDTSYEGIATKLSENLKRLQKGEDLANCVNLEEIKNRS
jgi:phosphoglycerate dehydrogenase-like enzyme